jgi:hypothetical protein
MARKKRKDDRKPAPLPGKLLAGLRDVDEHVRRGRWDEARDALVDLDRRFPDRKEVLYLLT